MTAHQADLQLSVFITFLMTTIPANFSIFKNMSILFDILRNVPNTRRDFSWLCAAFAGLSSFWRKMVMHMTANKKIESTLRVRNGALVNGLAHTVISRVKYGAASGQNRRLDVGTKMLFHAILDPNRFDLDRVCSDLEALQIGPQDIVERCVPAAAYQLGDGWLNDELSFARVSTASARLFGLCKEMSHDWSNARNDPNAPFVLVCTIGQDSHIVGPTVLVEKLRYRGCCVDTALNTTAENIVERLRTGKHQALMVSVSSYQTLELVSEAIKIVRQSHGIDVPVILGGAILDFENELQKLTGADLVTKDIETALSVVERQKSRIRAAQ